MYNKFKSFLEEIKPYVIAVGSYAKGTQNEFSDIDFYIKRKPQELIEELWENNCDDVEEYYMNEIIEIADRYNYYWSSVIIGHIAVEQQYGVPRMVEFSYHYKIPKTASINNIEIYGVTFESAIDDKGCDYENCIDYFE